MTKREGEATEQDKKEKDKLIKRIFGLKLLDFLLLCRCVCVCGWREGREQNSLLTHNLNAHFKKL